MSPGPLVDFVHTCIFKYFSLLPTDTVGFTNALWLQGTLQNPGLHAQILQTNAHFFASVERGL